MPQWIGTTPQQAIQTLPGSAALFGGNDPMLGGPGMMLPPPSPFASGSNNSGFLDPANLSTNLNIDQGELYHRPS